jgi:hypothetical protein
MGFYNVCLHKFGVNREAIGQDTHTHFSTRQADRSDGTTLCHGNVLPLLPVVVGQITTRLDCGG